MTIVFATDGSENARFAAQFLARYPAPPDTETLCCSVYSPISAVTGAAHPVLAGILTGRIAAAIEEVKQKAQVAAHDAAEFLSQVGFDAEALILEGDPASKICEIAQERNAALTVFGAAGTGGVEGLLTGSVARSLAHQSKGSFLVVRQHPFALPNGLRAIYATDLSEQSAASRKALPHLAPQRFAELEIVTVTSDMTAMKSAMKSEDQGASSVGEKNVDEWRSCITEWHDEKLRAIQNELISVAERITRTVILEGDPRRALVEHAAKHNADLVIAGARTHSLLSRLFIGSVSEHLVYRAPCSVMVIRA